MKLITNELMARFKKVGRQEDMENWVYNPLVICKFFNPCGGQTWYVTELDKDWYWYCFVTGSFYDEWGSFHLSELEEIKLPFGLWIERDLHFKECKFLDLEINN